MTPAISDTQPILDPEIQQASDALLASDADLQEEHAIHATGKCPFAHAAASTSQEPLPFEFIPLTMGGRGGTHKVSEGSQRLMQEVEFQDLKRMTQAFYQLAFQDFTLDAFIRNRSDPHGDRFARWIHQKMADSTLWDDERAARDLTPVTVANGRLVVVRDRSSAHSAAWFSPKRPAKDVGRHFQLDECRVWMRLHFWAMRQAGLVEKSPSFVDYYIRFIGHFVAVYEKRATKFARESFRWSADPKNKEAYLNNGRMMKDVLGIGHTEAKSILPAEELDYKWPYYQEAP